MSSCMMLIFTFALVCLPEVFLVLPPDLVVPATSPSDLYSEAPCEIRPTSAFKDDQGNVWGVGDGNLWWFNATNLSWSLLPMPNGTTTLGPWSVVCVDPKKYAVLMGMNSTLVLHLPWQHWQFADQEDVHDGNDGSFIDRYTIWCLSGVLVATDNFRKTLYTLDAEEAHWTHKEDIPAVFHVNWSRSHGVVNTLVGSNNELIVLEVVDKLHRVMYTNESGIRWVFVTRNSINATWPHLIQDNWGLSLAFKLESDLLWLWKQDHGVDELWSFDYNSTKWKQASRDFTRKLPKLSSVLTGWVQNGKYCVIKKGTDCTLQYSISATQCWSESEMIASPENSTESDTTPGSTAASATTAEQKTTVNVIPQPDEKATNYTSTTHMTSAPATTSKPIKITLPTNSYTQPPMKKPGVTKHQPQLDWKWKMAQNEIAQVGVIPSNDPGWHQHTSVFGSVIFFGTSITIFALFGLFYCGRKCVHFPKEALLLRDPPSVRYTAIPDSLTYDSRMPTPATYTVIPDSIA